MNSEKHNLVIIGAGVVGLSCAYKAKEILGENVEITIIAEKFLSETTTFGSGGLWEPYQIAGTPDESINKWGKIAFDHFLELYHGPYCGTAGVQLMNFYQLFRSDEKNISPSWKDIVFNFQQLSDAEILKMKLPPVYTSAYSFSTLVIEQKYYLTWLTNNLKSSGVKFIQKKILDLHELKGYDSIINCSGLGAYELMGDNSMYPIRGQVLRIKAPWIKNVWMFGSNYLIPNIDSIVVGGTQQKGDWNTIPSLEDTESILNNVCSLFPSLRDAQIVYIIRNMFLDYF